VVNKMKIYARVEAGAVAELLRTEANPANLFHKSLRWVEVTDPLVAVGWIEGPAGFVPPPIPEAGPAPLPTLADLHARIVELTAQVAALAPH
jgi:hypothetical protein